MGSFHILLMADHAVYFWVVLSGPEYLHNFHPNVSCKVSKVLSTIVWSLLYIRM